MSLLDWCSVFPFVDSESCTVLPFAEDVDPSVGRFRNMVQTAVVPVKVHSNFQFSNQSILTVINSPHGLHLRNTMCYGGIFFLRRSCVYVSQLYFLAIWPFCIKSSLSSFFNSTWNQWQFFFFLHPKRTTFQCGNSRHWLKLWEIRKTRSKNEKLFI